MLPFRAPGLRECCEDIPILARAFVAEFCAEAGVRTQPVSPRAMAPLMSHRRPGNVRELRNLMERLGEHGGNISRTAEAIGLARESLSRKIQSFPIEVECG